MSNLSNDSSQENTKRHGDWDPGTFHPTKKSEHLTISLLQRYRNRAPQRSPFLQLPSYHNDKKHETVCFYTVGLPHPPARKNVTRNGLELEHYSKATETHSVREPPVTLRPTVMGRNPDKNTKGTAVHIYIRKTQTLLSSNG